jgi:CPA2 family monovalent cation:H+ antiporter-2
MPHDTTLIGTVVAGLGVAFLMGALAQRVKISPIAGYLLAGILVGPFTPGFVADTGLAMQLAEIGVILLMFGVGLHFSLKDLLSVRKIAVPGAIAQIAVASGLGIALGLWLGWSVAGSAVFGLALSVASTVVLLRALQARDMVETEKGRIAVGWLIVEDLAMVLALVLLPAMFGSRGDEGQGAGLLQSAGIVLFKVVAFVAFMAVIARRVLPWVLHWVAHTGSRELFRLAVLAIALGVAFGAAVVFDVSFALGAFFAGMILGETQLSRRAAEETLPLRDAFAVLFFVSVGMLFDPMVLVEQPGPVIATVAIIVVGKSVAAYWIVRAFGHGSQTAMTVSVSLAQIGEFSFILAGLGVGLQVLPETGRDLILAGSLLSILFNPIFFTLAVKRIRSEDASGAEAEAAAPASDTPAPCNAGVVLIGFGRVGSHIGTLVCGRGEGLTVIEDQKDMAAAAEKAGARVIVGDATKESILRQAGIEDASTLLIAIPEGVEAGAIVRKARAINARLVIVARAHSDEEVDDLVRRGADHVVMAERVTAARMAERAMLART